MVSDAFRNNYGRGVWVPAFAGTTLSVNDAYPNRTDTFPNTPKSASIKSPD